MCRAIIVYFLKLRKEHPVLVLQADLMYLQSSKQTRLSTFYVRLKIAIDFMVNIFFTDKHY